MTPARARVSVLVLGAAVALGAAAALRLVPPVPHLPGDLVDGPHEPRIWSRTDTLALGESLASLLARGGLATGEAATALRAAPALDDRRIPAGLEVVLQGDSTDERPREITLALSYDRVLRLRRDGDSWNALEERIPWTTDTVVVHGVVRSTLYDAIDEGADSLLSEGARAELAWSLADIYEYRIDMSRDLQDGDAVRVVVERARSNSGATRVGTILAAGVERAGEELNAIRFLSRGAARAEYYDRTGRSLRSSFLRAPLSFRRISSVFGRRKHPILGSWRTHAGTDYAAGAGTPVRSVGDGVVAFAGRRGGYGNCIDVRHPNGFVTRYGHLKGFTRDLRPGTRVAMGQTIGFVGVTGLATGPHLHFEVLVGGVQRDPRGALKQSAGLPLARGDTGRFGRTERLALAALDRPAGQLRVPVSTP